MTETCDDVFVWMQRDGEPWFRFQQAHGCGHPLAQHTDGMKCRACGRDCARADGQELDVPEDVEPPVGLDRPEQGKLL